MRTRDRDRNGDRKREEGLHSEMQREGRKARGREGKEEVGALCLQH